MTDDPPADRNVICARHAAATGSTGIVTHLEFSGDQEEMHDILEPLHHKIVYVEFASADPARMCDFFGATLGWSFEWFGEDYVAFHGAGLEGGIYRADLASRSADGATLVVFYSRDLEASERLFHTQGASIIKPVFSFPGGRRFQFAEPTGNEFAV